MNLTIGQTASLTKSFTEKDVELFAELSLDKNEIHINDEYAKASIFKQRIVHGFLSGSLISAVIGTILPGKGAIYLHQDMDFKKPVYIGEEITAVVEVERLKEEKRICYLQTRCENRDGEVKISGNAIVKY